MKRPSGEIVTPAVPPPNDGTISPAGASLPLVRESEEVEEMVPGRPYQFTTTWQELLEGKVNGRYEMVSHGALIHSMAYTNARTGKRTEFSWIPGIEVSGDDGCRW